MRSAPMPTRSRGATCRRRVRELVVGLRVVAHRTVGVHLLADGAARLTRARRAWAFHRAMDRLAVRNGCDEAIVSSITNDDEYGVVEARFQATDVVVDVGAQVGAFSLVCHRRGSRSIHAFEPDAVSFALLERNVGSLRGVETLPRAVFRSDLPVPRLRLSEGIGANSGSAGVLFGGRSFEIETQRFVGDGIGCPVEATPLDDVLRRFEHVRLLKLDCEGSEFPILLTSLELGRVREIVGEVHEIGRSSMASLAPSARLADLPEYRAELLVARLSALGFRVTLGRRQRNLALFRAVRAGSR